MYIASDSNHGSSSTFSMDSAREYQAAKGASMASNYGMYDDRPGYQGASMTSTDESADAANRARLTQEQLAQLEREFVVHHKPNTEYKKSLAEQMCVDYAKVNNWFQNRRAKAKHEGQPRSDPSIGDETFHLPGTDYQSVENRRIFEPHHSSFDLPADQSIMLVRDYAMDHPLDRSNSYHPQYNNHPEPFTATMGGVPQFNDSTTLQSIFLDNTPANSSWPASTSFHDTTEKIATTSVLEVDQVHFPSESPSIHPYGLDALQASNGDCHSQPMYHNLVDGHIMGNPSSHSFVTSPSEEGEHASLITPPQETSPLPGINQGVFQYDRRTSNSSELAENFDTIHLQQSQACLGPYDTSHSVSAPNIHSSTGLPTPEISPDTDTTTTPFPSGRDLASRRKRPRPAALQPDSNRSASYAGPSTASPHLRVTPPRSGKMSPVRRIRSTGYNLNVMTGRVKKPGTISAQMSPRNIESFLKVSSLPEVQSSSSQNSNSTQIPDTATNDTLQSPPNLGAQQSQLPWSGSPPHYAMPAPSWAPQPNGDAACTYGQEGAFHWAPPQHNYTNSMGHLPYEHISHPPSFGNHCPPQSAPSHITTFSEVPSVMSGDIQTSWPVPSRPPPQRYCDNIQLPIPVRPNHPHHHSHSGPFNYSTFPDVSFQGFPSGIEPYQPYHQHFDITPPPISKSFEIKVETGPAPPKELTQAYQDQKEYTFQNQFANSFPANNSKK